MSDQAAVRATVFGTVKGVYFRDFTMRKATELGITGYVRNLRLAEAVEVVAEGEKNRLVELISHLKVGPQAAKVTNIVTDWTEYTGSYRGFQIKD